MHEQPAGRGEWFSTLLTPHTASEPRGFHQPCYSPPSATDPKRAKLCVHPRVAVGFAAPAMDLADLLGEKGVLPPPLRGRPATPGVVTALGDSEHPAQHRNRVAGPLLKSMSLKALTDPRSLPWALIRPLLFGGSLSLGEESSPHAGVSLEFLFLLGG